MTRGNAILDAALREFMRQGFAGARMEDIAQRAGIAKGTVYLYFRDKQALFEALVKREMSPVLEAARAPLPEHESVRAFMERILLAGVREPGRSRRTAVIRLLIAESGRFPKLAEMYFQAVVKPGIEICRTLAARAREQGELKAREPVRFPQLVVAPMILSFLWAEFFERFEPLEYEAMLRAHLDLLFHG